jgi:hypothetical protein
MAYRIEIDAVQVDDEGAVVVGMVLRPQARAPVVGGARRQRGGMEGLDLGAGLGGEGEVDALATFSWANQKKGLPSTPRPAARSLPSPTSMTSPMPSGFRAAR